MNFAFTGRICNLCRKGSGSFLCVCVFIQCCCKLYCKLHHRDTTPEKCTQCRYLVHLSERISNEGVCELSSLYRATFPTVQYQSDKAVRKLMQLPVAIFKLELSGPGSQRLYVSEVRTMVDYDTFSQVCQMVFSSETMKKKGKKPYQRSTGRSV